MEKNINLDLQKSLLEDVDVELTEDDLQLLSAGRRSSFANIVGTSDLQSC